MSKKIDHPTKVKDGKTLGKYLKNLIKRSENSEKESKK